MPALPRLKSGAFTKTTCAIFQNALGYVSKNKTRIIRAEKLTQERTALILARASARFARPGSRGPWRGRRDTLSQRRLCRLVFPAPGPADSGPGRRELHR